MTSKKYFAPCCAFIPVYCYYSDARGEVKAPILIADKRTYCFKALILNIDPDIFNPDELKDEFVRGYYDSARLNKDGFNSFDSYDIYPQRISVLHTDNEEISIYVCELYENSENYFKSKTQLTESISYKEEFDKLLANCRMEELTEKILVHLSEKNIISPVSKDKITASVELF